MFGHLRSTWKWVTTSTTALLLLAGLTIVLFSPVVTHLGTAHADTKCDPLGILLNGTLWLNGTGVNICNNGSDPSKDAGGTTPSCVAVSGAPGDSHCPKGNVYAGEEWQCVEMVNRLYLTKGWTKATWYGDGNTLINSVPSGLTKQNNGSVSYVNPGDVITLDDGGFGHAGIINNIDSNGTIHIKNQNAQLDSSAYIDSGSLSNGNAHYHMNYWKTYKVQAIIHHRSGSTGTKAITPASISFNGALNVFTVGGDRQVYQQYWNGSRWSGFSSIGGSFVSNPAVIINAGALNIFERGPDNQIYTEYNGGNGWSGWSSSLGSHQMKGNPAVIHYGSEMDVFALDTNNVPYKATWNSSIGWGSGWTSMGNFMASSPAAIQYGSEMDVFYRGGDNNIYKNTWNGSSWGGFGSLGAPSGTTVVGNPSVLSYAAEGEYNIFVNTSSGHIYKRTWNGAGWSSWTDMGGGFTGNPYATTYGSDMEVYARGTNNQIYTRYWSYGGQFWSAWSSLGGTLASDPYALQYGTSELDVFATGTDGKTYKDTFNPTNGWGGFSALN